MNDFTMDLINTIPSKMEYFDSLTIDCGYHNNVQVANDLTEQLDGFVVFSLCNNNSIQVKHSA